MPDEVITSRTLIVVRHLANIHATEKQASMTYQEIGGQKWY
jgi:hypothetical protein